MSYLQPEFGLFHVARFENRENDHTARSIQTERLEENLGKNPLNKGTLGRALPLLSRVSLSFGPERTFLADSAG